MAVQTATVVAASSAVILYRCTTPGGVHLLMTTHNNSADVYLGGSTVTPSSNGVVMPKSQNLQVFVPCGETLYIAGNGTDTVKWLVVGD